MSSQAPPTPAAAVTTGSPQRRQLSCLGKTIIAFIDGGSFGAAIGAIVASAQGVSGVAGGSESMGGAVRGIARAGLRSGASLGLALAGCTRTPTCLSRIRAWEVYLPWLHIPAADGAC